MIADKSRFIFLVPGAETVEAGIASLLGDEFFSNFLKIVKMIFVAIAVCK